MATFATISKTVEFLSIQFIQCTAVCPTILCPVVVSLFSNLVVVAVMLLRPQKLRSTHVLIMALAASDIMFSLVISVTAKLIITFIMVALANYKGNNVT